MERFVIIVNGLQPLTIITKLSILDVAAALDPPLETTTLCNYADDNTMYSSDKNFNIVISRIGYNFAIISKWFYENYMLLNPDKCHFLTLSFNKPFPDFSFENTIIKNFTEEKILGIVIDNNLNFKSHMKIYVKKLTKNSVHLQEFQN